MPSNEYVPLLPLYVEDGFGPICVIDARNVTIADDFESKELAEEFVRDFIAAH